MYNKSNKTGILASIIGIIANVILATSKIVVGSIFGVISVVADGLNNFTDCGSSIISMVSFKLSSKPADEEHPFGHERIEYVCSLAISFIMVLVAFETAKESIGKIISSEQLNFSIITLGVLLFSILTKLSLFFYYRATSKKINSVILSATAKDCLNDCVSTGVVLASLIISKFTGFNIDGYAGILVVLFICFSAFGILKDTFSNLIGKAPETQLLCEIKDRILSKQGVLGVHDLSVYCYGPNKFFASAHIEVDAKVDVLISHEMVDEIERDFIQNTNVVLTAHLDPVVIDDERVTALKQKIEDIVCALDQSFSIHDFRVVFGERNSNVLFDVAIPYNTKHDKNYIKEYVESEIYLIDNKLRPIITIEFCL